MTPERHDPVAHQALQLRQLLNATAVSGEVDLVAAARKARQVFTDAADDVRVRWLGLELAGYAALVDQRPLHEVLGIRRDDRLVAHVAAYRAQEGVELAPNAGGRAFTHFFVEPLPELLSARDRVRASSGSAPLELTFGADTALPGYPTAARFARDVFERITGGFGAALYLQLGTLPGASGVPVR
ncbi:MAG: hypothetical protein JW940_20785 [Polyangiaceae bacterium]|nr:hypothetical protein [Polyangiaceae bacterium]